MTERERAPKRFDFPLLERLSLRAFTEGMTAQGMLGNMLDAASAMDDLLAAERCCRNSRED